MTSPKLAKIRCGNMNRHMIRFLFSALLGLASTHSMLAQQSVLNADAFASPGSSQSVNPFGTSGIIKYSWKNDDTVITAAASGFFDNDTGTGRFVGGVILKNSQLTLFCDKLTVYLEKHTKVIDHAFAEGHVIVVQDNIDDSGKTMRLIGRSGTVLFEPATGRVTFKVWPSIQRGSDSQIPEQEGTAIVLSRNGQTSTIYDGVGPITDDSKVPSSSTPTTSEPINSGTSLTFP